MAAGENEMGLIHRLSDLFSMGTVTTSQTDLLTGCPASRGSSRAASLPEVSAPTAMDGHCQEDIEKTFQFLIHYLGGREAVLMVGDIYSGGSQCEKGLLCWEVAQELFRGTQRSRMELGEAANLKVEDEGAQTPGLSACPVGSRSITAKLILFVFREEWLKEQEGRAMVREILKDVRQRCQLFVPTVLGLIYCQSDGSQLSDSLILLAHSISEVFDIPQSRAPACVNAYIRSRPSSILNTKRLICELLTSSDTETASLSHKDNRIHSRPILRPAKDIPEWISLLLKQRR